LLKGVLQVTTSVAILLVICNSILSTGQLQWLLNQLGLLAFTGGVQELAQAPDLRDLPELPTVKANKALQKINGEKNIQQFNCFRPVTEALPETSKNQVYRWVDEAGKRHFSDQPPAHFDSEDLSHRYASEADYFELTITSPDGGIDPLLQEQLSRDVAAIYRYLTDDLGLQKLRKVRVDLKLFNQSANYRVYQQQYAPNLKGSVGFYSALNNEAVVLSQQDREITKQIARHEATHVIMAGLFGVTPMWLNEGLAELFADYRNQALSRQFVSQPYRLAQLAAMGRAGTFYSAQAFFRISPPQWQQANPAVMYSTAWALVKFMLQDPIAREALLAIFDRLAKMPCAQINAIQTIESTYPNGIQGFEVAWQDWLRQLTTVTR